MMMKRKHPDTGTGPPIFDDAAKEGSCSKIPKRIDPINHVPGETQAATEQQSCGAEDSRLIVEIGGDLVDGCGPMGTSDPGYRMYNIVRDTLSNEDAEIPLYSARLGNEVHVAVQRSSGTLVFVPGFVQWLIKRVHNGEVVLRFGNELMPILPSRVDSTWNVNANDTNLERSHATSSSNGGFKAAIDLDATEIGLKSLAESTTSTASINVNLSNDVAFRDDEEGTKIYAIKAEEQTSLPEFVDRTATELTALQMPSSLIEVSEAGHATVSTNSPQLLTLEHPNEVAEVIATEKEVTCETPEQMDLVKLGDEASSESSSVEILDVPGEMYTFGQEGKRINTKSVAITDSNFIYDLCLIDRESQSSGPVTNTNGKTGERIANDDDQSSSGTAGSHSEDEVEFLGYFNPEVKNISEHTVILSDEYYQNQH